jgi:hypothetical protein
MRRFSIPTLMAFVLVSAVGLAALRNANDLWVGMMILLALTAVGVAGRGGEPYSRPGAAVVAWLRSVQRRVSNSSHSGGGGHVEHQDVMRWGSPEQGFSTKG